MLILLIAVPVCFIDNADTVADSPKSHSTSLLYFKNSKYTYGHTRSRLNNFKDSNRRKVKRTSRVRVRDSSIPNIEYGSINCAQSTYSQLLSNLHSIN